MEQRLIDTNALTKKYCKEPAKGDCKNCDWYGDSWCRGEIFGVQIAEFPTVDAVEVVRCGKCKHQKRLSEEESRFYGSEDVLWCTRQRTYSSTLVNENHFCAYGEREVDNG